MQYKDYYRILGLSRDASAEEIKAAYRKLARRYHPDVSKEANAELRFKEVSEAYEALRDPQKRMAYDRLGGQWRAGDDFRSTSRRGPGAGARSDFSDFYDSIFGGFGGAGRFDDGFAGERRRQGFGARGQDQEASVQLSLEEAYTGVTREITVQSPALNPGGGISARPRTLRVKIPAGVQQGQQIRLPGQGSAGLGGGAKGDLYLSIELQAHPLFQLEGRDVHLDLPIAPWEAALGAKLEVPTLAGPVGLAVPAGSQSGRKLRLRGRGLPGSPAGDQYVRLKIVTPPADTPSLRRLYEQLQSASAFDPRQHLSR